MVRSGLSDCELSTSNASEGQKDGGKAVEHVELRVLKIDSNDWVIEV